SGGDYKTSLGQFADGLFVAITPDGTLFGTLPTIFAGSWRYLGTAQASDLSFANISKWLGGISALTWLNVIILIGFIYAAWRIPRFWCRYICPVGAIMAVTQKTSLLGMHRDPIKFSDCTECETAFPMQILILVLDLIKFSASTIAVAGVGGVGSSAAYYLARSGVGTIRLVDQDIVEPSNLPRIHGASREDLFHPKAEVISRRLSDSGSRSSVETVVETITDRNVADLFKDVDLIFDGLDNFRTRYILNKFALQSQTP